MLFSIMIGRYERSRYRQKYRRLGLLMDDALTIYPLVLLRFDNTAGRGAEPVAPHRTSLLVGGGNVPRVAAKLPIASADGKPRLKISEGDWKRIEKAYGHALTQAAAAESLRRHA